MATPEAERTARAQGLVLPEGEAFEQLKLKIHRERGFNTQYYKDKCLRRRIAVRMRARGLPGVGDYSELLDSDPREFDQLVRALTINVTKFFRNIDMWRVLESRVLPDLFSRPGRRQMWSAGCATGEEPYTLSILIREWAEREGRTDVLSRYRIIGTDIDSHCLNLAREGIYPELAFAETPAAIRARWFSPGLPSRLQDAARRSVDFRQLDVISEPPLEQQSLILCRNVIIYFDREIQDELFTRFHRSLEPGGYLVLGKVETLLGPARALFEPVSTRERVFRKRS